MHVYIKHIKQGEDKIKPINEYSFTKSVEDARHWDTAESAELAMSMICNGGITVKTLDGRSAYCTGFKIASPQQDVFVISCEHPHESDQSDHV